MRLSKRPEHVAGPQEGQPGAVPVGQFPFIDVGQHRFGLLATSQPRQRMRGNETRFRAGTGSDGRLRKTIGEGQICQPDRALSSPGEQIGVWREVRLDRQGRATHHRRDVIRVLGSGEFGSDQSAQPSQPSSRRPAAADLAVQRMRQPHLDTTHGGLQHDQAARLGLFHSGRTGDSRQRRQVDRLADCQHVDHIADRPGQGSDPRFDEFGKAGWDDRISDPAPQTVLSYDSPLGHLMFHDVAQIQDVAERELP